jgi:hypothetical protein
MKPPRLAHDPHRRSSGAARRGAIAVLALVVYPLLSAAGCRFDRSDRWLNVVGQDLCVAGELRCRLGVERCSDEGTGWVVADACSERGLVCEPTTKQCASCQPGQVGCVKGAVGTCRADGNGFQATQACDLEQGLACRQGSCLQLCDDARKTSSNVGCEYWGVDLDNAALGASLNASGQQYAIVISNPHSDVPVTVTITQDDGEPGGPPAPSVVAEGNIPPFSLRVFRLGPREVDGSPDGEFNTGTGTALTRHAYRVQSNFPIIAYQFNPLENANVFSNDASLLKPVSALGSPTGGEPQPAYVVVGWPQTIAASDDPNTNFDPAGRTQLRAFLTLVGTRDGTKVRVRSRTRVLAGGPLAETPSGGLIEATLGAYDVLNLETDDFNADFTGSIIETTGPVAVFSGSEASDAPMFTTISGRFCCADHLEEQLDPIRTAGTSFVAAHGPSRTRTVVNAGAKLPVVAEPDFFRVVAAADGETVVHTTLPPPDDTFTLSERGDFRGLTALTDFLLDASSPVILGNVSPSQEAAGVRRGLPGGDPSLLVVPPIQQYRNEYVFLTPDKYSFDFLTVLAKPGEQVALDGELLDDKRCVVTPGDGLSEQQRGLPLPPYLVYTCQLGFAAIDPSKAAPENLTPGQQDDGVHRLVATSPVGVLVSGFDSFVSYSYAAGTELREINIQ